MGVLPGEISLSCVYPSMSGENCLLVPPSTKLVFLSEDGTR